jgi:hypothetical protein
VPGNMRFIKRAKSDLNGGSMNGSLKCLFIKSPLIKILETYTSIMRCLIDLRVGYEQVSLSALPPPAAPAAPSRHQPPPAVAIPPSWLLPPFLLPVSYQFHN